MKNIYTINLNLDKSKIAYFSSTLLKKIEENIVKNKKYNYYILTEDENFLVWYVQIVRKFINVQIVI